MRLWWVLGSFALTIFLTACAQAAAPSGPQEDAGQQSMSALQYFQSKASWNCEPGKEHWRSAGTPKRGGTFIKADASSATPTLERPLQVYEHLLESRACYYEDTMFGPGLAKSWTVSPDGLTWTLKLDEKAKWQNLPPLNGRPFTSADVAWLIDYHIAEGELRSIWLPVTHQEPDAHTIVLKLKDPDPDFIGNVLGERNNVMWPREIREQHGDFKGVAVGTGPYLVKEWKPNQILRLERTPDWREMGADGKALPYIDRVEFPVFSDYTAEVAAMRVGQIDLNQTLGYLKRDFDALMQANPKLKSYQDIAPIPRGLWMNNSRKPFDDIRVRKALRYATDADEVIELAFSGGAVRTGYLPTAISAYAWPVDKVRELFKPDLEKAKQLLTEAGYGPSNPLVINMKMGNVPSDQGGEVTQAQLKKVGVEVKIEVTQGNATPRSVRFDYDTTWSGSSPASIFANRWMGAILRCGDPANETRLCDPEVDRLSLAQARELDPVKRKTLLDQLQQRLLEVVPMAPQLSLVYYRLYSCRVKNMPSTEYTQRLTGIHSAWLDDTGC